MEAFPCTICNNAGHKSSKCPELWHPEKAGGGGHAHEDDDEKSLIATLVLKCGLFCGYFEAMFPSPQN